jgi:hypothetical protein
MRRIILLLIVIFITKMVSAQPVETGLRLNFNSFDWHGYVWQNISELTGQSSDVASLRNRRGFGAGIYASVPVGPYVDIESGLYYEQKGMGVRIRPFESFLSPEVRTTVQLNYLTVPLNINVKTWGGLYITGGASISHLISSKLGIRGSWLGFGIGESFPIKKAFNNWDFNVQGGALYQFDNGFQVKAEYQHGLSRIYGGLIGADVYNQGFSMGIGFKF